MPDTERLARMEWLADWAALNGVKVVVGECGFGRPCVGLADGEQWVYRSYYDAEFRDAPGGLDWMMTGPPDGVPTFDKGALLVVLFDGDDVPPGVDIATGLEDERIAAAFDGLHRWVTDLDSKGIVVKVVPKLQMDVLKMLGTMTEPVLMMRA